MSSKSNLWPVVISGILASAVYAGDVDVDATLQKPLKISIKNKLFDDALRELCAAAALPVEVRTIKRDREGGQGGGGSHTKGPDQGLTIKCVHINGDALYSLEATELIPLAKLIDELDTDEGCERTLENGKLKIVPAFDAPFDPARVLWNRNKDIAPVDDWRKAVTAIMQERAARIAAEDKPVDPMERMKNFNKMPVGLQMSVGALRSHRDADAVRIWLLCEATAWVLDNANCNSNEVCVGYAIAAAREAKKLLAGAAAQTNLKDLATVLRPFFKDLPATTPDANFLTMEVAEAYLLAADAYMRYPIFEEAQQWAHDAAYTALAAGNDSLFDNYHPLVAHRLNTTFVSDGYMVPKHGPEWIKVAEEDLKAASANAQLPKEALARFHHRLSRAYQCTNQSEKALVELKAAFEIDPKNGGISHYDAAFQIVSHRGPMGTFRKPKSDLPDPAVDLAMLMSSCKQMPDAIALLQKTYRENPTNTRVLSKLVLLLKESGDKTGAIARCKEWREIDPADETAIATLASLEGRTEKVADGAGGTKTVIPDLEARKVRAAALQKEIDELKTAKKYDDALAKTRAALKEFPANVTLMSTELTLLILLDRGAEAKVLVEQYENGSAEFRQSGIGTTIRGLIGDAGAAKQPATPPKTEKPPKPPAGEF